MPRITYHKPDCTDACCAALPTAAQNLDEISFTRSAAAAALSGNLTKLQSILSKNPQQLTDDGYGGTSGYTPLHYAAREGHAHIVAFLLQQQGANPNAKIKTSNATPLHRAAITGQIECVKLLLECRETDVMVRDADGQTALHKAAQQGHREVVELLLAHSPALADVVDTKARKASDMLLLKGL